MRLRRPSLLLLAGLALPSAARAETAALVGTAFTYQGQLHKTDLPHQGTADFVFRLWNDPVGGSQVGSDFSVSGLELVDGLFTTTLDFGNVFDGTAYWLELGVRTAGDPGTTFLSPRQPVLPAPYALRALSAPGGSGGSQWTDATHGIHYSGHVGVGTAATSSHVLRVDSGTTNSNTAYFSSSNGAYPALYVRNFATGGYGFFDDTSPRHYLYGSLGLGTSTPGPPLDVLNTLGNGARIIATGSSLDPERAALSVMGNTGGGVFGRSAMGIISRSTDDRAIAGFSANSFGVTGDCTSAGTWGALGTLNEGVFGFSGTTARPAAKFMAPSGGTAIDAQGLVKVKTLQILGGADVAEPFDVRGDEPGAPDPGSLVVIDAANPGDLRVSDRAYDTRVAGVISGANDLAPGMVLRAEGDALADGGHAVALTGRVWCKADAGFGAIAPGDLLTTSPTAGHAMKAADPARRGGAVIGKAMTALSGGRGLVLVLVNLQ